MSEQRKKRSKKPGDSGRDGRSRAGSSSRGKSGGGDRSGGKRSSTSRRSSGTGRSQSAQGRNDPDHQRVDSKRIPAAAEGLPRHIVEALVRVTPAQRQNAALAALAAAAEAFSEGQYHVAVRKAEHAKDLASRDATIREILGLASYRVGDWAAALRELRTYRRLSGETTHMAVEMDVLRALNRAEDVTATWNELRKRGGSPAAKKEGRVVYASFLIDRGELDEAAEIAGNPKLAPEPWPEDLRLWFVAARIAALQGDRRRARSIADAILLEDPSFPGLDQLDREIDAI